MDFRYNQVTRVWEHHENKDSKFRITTVAGNVIEIPNFIETQNEFIQTLRRPTLFEAIGEIEYQNGIPVFTVYPLNPDLNTRRYSCNILTGQWGECIGIGWMELLTITMDHDNQVLQKRVQTLERQMKEMMSMWNHVRESNVIVDEWLKTAKSVITMNCPK